MSRRWRRIYSLYFARRIEKVLFSVFSKKVEKGEFTGTWILTVGSDEDDAPEYKGILIQAQQSGKHITKSYVKTKSQNSG